MSTNMINIEKDFHNVLNEVRAYLDPSQFQHAFLPILFYKHYSHKNKEFCEIHGDIGIETLDFFDINIQHTVNKYISNINLILNTDTSFSSIQFDFEYLTSEFEAIHTLLKYVSILEIETLKDMFNYSISNNKSLSRNDMFSYTPESINDLLVQLVLEDKTEMQDDLKIYDPTCGYGNSLIAFAKRLTTNVALNGQELDFKIARLAQINIYFNVADSKNSTIIKQGDTLLSPQFIVEGAIETFDYIISQPPFNVPLNKELINDTYKRWDASFVNHLSNNAFILHIISSLKLKGKAAIVVSNNLLISSKGEDISLRKHLLEMNVLSGVISLGSKLLYNTSIPISVLILDRSTTKKDTIRFVDASEEFDRLNQVQNQLSKKNIQTILELFNNIDDVENKSRKVNVSEISANNYSLFPIKYTSVVNEIVNDDIHTIKLGDILTFLRPITGDSESEKFISISELSQEPYATTIEGKPVPKDFKASNYFLLEQKALLISSVLPLRLGICNASKENPIWIAKSIFATKWDEKLIDINYLIMELMSEFSLSQLEIFLKGSSIPRLNRSLILEHLIRIPNVIEQNLSVQRLQFESAKIQYDKDKIASNNLQSTIDTLIKERFEEFQWDLHDLRNSELLAVSQQVQILNKVVAKYPEVNQIIVDPNKNINLDSFVKRLMDNTKNLADKLTTIYDFSGASSNQKKIDIVQKLRSFMNNQKFIDLSTINYEFITESIDETIQLSGTMKVLFNEIDLEKILNNVIENISRHAGFNYELSKDNKISIQFEMVSSTQVKVTFLNSGKRTEVSPSVFFSRDRKWGNSGNSGLGGYAIKKLATRNMADVSIETYSEGDFVFGLTLIMDRVYDVIL